MDSAEQDGILFQAEEMSRTNPTQFGSSVHVFLLCRTIYLYKIVSKNGLLL